MTQAIDLFSPYLLSVNTIDVLYVGTCRHMSVVHKGLYNNSTPLWAMILYKNTLSDFKSAAASRYLITLLVLFTACLQTFMLTCAETVAMELKSANKKNVPIYNKCGLKLGHKKTSSNA